MTSFTPIQLSEREDYYRIWHATPEHSIDYTLANLWGWHRYFELSWCFADEIIFIKQERQEPIFWAPLGPWEKIDWDRVLSRLSDEQKTFIRVPELLVDIWREQIPDRIHVVESRGQWEYLYKQTDLATLPGKAFHKKKNHYSSFVKTYGEPDYHPICDSIVEDVLSLQDEWCQWHECEDSTSLQAENEAINQVLSHWQCFQGMQGGAIYIDGRIAAFSVGEKLDEKTLGVHYEKGLLGYKGIYQAMNRTFAANAGKEYELLNRAQDLDEEGLRQAKESYHPSLFLKKYQVMVD